MLELRLLGTPGVTSHGEATAVSAIQGQSLALLAVLACAGERGVAREKLFTLFWPDAAAEPAAHRLSQLSHSTRRALGCPDLVSGQAELKLNPVRTACDLWAFCEARRAGELDRAAALYGGPFLDGFFLPHNAEFEHWAE